MDTMPGFQPVHFVPFQEIEQIRLILPPEVLSPPVEASRIEVALSWDSAWVPFEVLCIQKPISQKLPPGTPDPRD
jgi:hypothetical protein